MIIEVTKHFYRSVVSVETKNIKVDKHELYIDIFYLVNDVILIERVNHGSGVISYHIQDINMWVYPILGGL